MGKWDNDLWKNNLDRYLTTEPIDNMTPWVEQTLDNLSDDFYNKNSAWVDAYDGTCNKWLNKLYESYKEPKAAAQILERAFNLYKPHE